MDLRSGDSDSFSDDGQAEDAAPSDPDQTAETDAEPTSAESLFYGEEIGRPVAVSPEQIARLQSTVAEAGSSDELKGLGQAWRQALAAHNDDSIAVQTYLAQVQGG